MSGSGEVPAAPPTRRGRRAASRRSRGGRRLSLSAVVGVVGELLITAGVLVLLFLGWQLWLNDLVVGGQQRQAAQELAQTWDDPEPEPSASPPEDEGEPAGPAPDPGEPVVAAAPARGEAFATLMVPRFGADYVRVIGEGVHGAVINSEQLGIGHYPSTQMPGETGNFAIAAHRRTYGGAFLDLNALQVGDRMYVETADGWYVYAYRSTEYVLPTGVDVLSPVPQAPGVPPGDRFITLTTCNPLFSAAERLIAYGVLEAWYPRAGGPPAEVADTVNARG